MARKNEFPSIVQHTIMTQDTELKPHSDLWQKIRYFLKRDDKRKSFI
jgi:hypothetical protein